MLITNFWTLLVHLTLLESFAVTGGLTCIQASYHTEINGTLVPKNYS